MFDIGFLELVLVSIVGLLVLGPERLPVAARTVGKYVGRLRRSFNSVRAEIERELHNQEVMEKLKEAGHEITSGIASDDDVNSGHGPADILKSLAEPLAGQATKPQEPSAYKEPSAGKEPSTSKAPSAHEDVAADPEQPAARESAENDPAPATDAEPGDDEDPAARQGSAKP